MGLTAPQSSLLRGRLQKLSFNAGDCFIHAGDPGDALFLIADGQVEVRRPDGAVLALLRKGHFVGEMALLNREPRMADVVAITKVRAWRLAWEDFEPLAVKLPELKLFLTRLVAHRLHWTGKDLLSRRIGNYEVVERVGEGGMGWVFRGLQLPSENEVAIKMLPHPLVTRYGFLERFRNEAIILNRLRHENIVTVYDTLEAYGTIFIVMEFVRGVTAREWCSRATKVSPQHVRAIAYALYKALQHAHKQGIIHRDVKPDNIMIREDGCVKLMDFGIAQQLKSGIADPGGFTPQYAAPEVLRGQPVSPAADFYSLGVTLFEILTGQLPFIGTTLNEWVQLHCDEPPPPLSNFMPRIPDDLQALVAAMLIKDPQQRWTALESRLRQLGPRLATAPAPQRMGIRTRSTPLLVLWLRRASDSEERALLLERPLIVGRGSRADVRLDDPTTSARHCMIGAKADGIYVRDLDSRNGTVVNNRRVLTAKLNVGDEIRLGCTILTVNSISRSGIHIIMQSPAAPA